MEQGVRDSRPRGKIYFFEACSVSGDSVQRPLEFWGWKLGLVSRCTWRELGRATKEPQHSLCYCLSASYGEGSFICTYVGMSTSKYYSRHYIGVSSIRYILLFLFPFLSLSLSFNFEMIAVILSWLWSKESEPKIILTRWFMTTCSITGVYPIVSKLRSTICNTCTWPCTYIPLVKVHVGIVPHKIITTKLKHQVWRFPMHEIADDSPRGLRASFFCQVFSP